MTTFAPNENAAEPTRNDPPVVDLRSWREAFRSFERTCPRVGPRPLSAADPAEALVGRGIDAVRFRQEVDSHRLVLLSGESGVGKTSLLMHSLVPGLERSGYVVAVCNDWSGLGDVGAGPAPDPGWDPEPATFLAPKIRAALHDKGVEVPASTGPAMFWDLERDLGRRLVIVLDQFEELIRDFGAMAEKVYGLLKDINHHTHIRVVVSFRSEFLSHMRRLEQWAKPFTLSRYILDEVDDKEIGKILTNVDSDATELLLRSWKAARDPERGREAGEAGTAPGRVGVLHLQALLYALHFDALNGPADTDANLGSDPGSGAPAKEPIPIGQSVHPLITGTAVTRWAAGCSAQDLFSKGLESAIQLKTDHCRQCAARFDPWLAAGTGWTVARAARHLSSAGYKLIREVRDLIDVTLEDDLRTLQRATGHGSADSVDSRLSDARILAMIRLMMDLGLDDTRAEHDLLTASRSILAELADKRIHQSGDLDRSPTWTELIARTAAGDPTQVTSGLMLGMPPAAVLIEEIRRFVFALVWMDESAIIRVSRSGNASPRVSLVHDGLGSAIQRWGDRELESPSGPLVALTAPRGVRYDWPGMRNGNELDAATPALQGTPENPRVITNLRWRGVGLGALLDQVVFVNCDFRGSYFDRCTFRGVTFANCLLDGAMFTDCTILGAVAADDSPYSEKPPRVQIPVFDPTEDGLQSTVRISSDDPPLLRELARYRDRPSGEEVRGLFSPGAGLPAVVLEQASDEIETTFTVNGDRRRVAEEDQPPLALPLHPGGMIVFGGRLSTLMVRNSTIAAGSCISFRHVAGSSLEVVERTEGRYEISGCAFRQVSFTAPNVARSATSDQRPTIEITARGSVLSGVWFGHTLCGTFEADECVLVNVWNGSPTLTASASGGLFHNLVNVAAMSADAAMLPGERALKLYEPLLDADASRSTGLDDGPEPVFRQLARRFTLDSVKMDYRRDPSEQVAIVAPAEIGPGPAARPALPGSAELLEQTRRRFRNAEYATVLADAAAAFEARPRGWLGPFDDRAELGEVWRMAMMASLRLEDIAARDVWRARAMADFVASGCRNGVAMLMLPEFFVLARGAAAPREARSILELIRATAGGPEHPLRRHIVESTYYEKLAYLCAEIGVNTDDPVAATAALTEAIDAYDQALEFSRSDFRRMFKVAAGRNRAQYLLATTEAERAAAVVELEGIVERIAFDPDRAADVRAAAEINLPLMRAGHRDLVAYELE